MGFGRCLLQTTTTKKKPTNKLTDATRNHKPRAHCDSFYWDISSVILKTACLATFFIAESPRRIVSYITRKPEPKPFFICSKWGYRMCACGHHYYDHQDVSDSEKFFTTNAISQDPSQPTEDGAAVPDTTQKTADGFSIKGGSFKDIIRRLAEQAAANQGAESSTDATIDSSTTDSSPSPTPPPEPPKKRKHRRRWYWPF